MITTASIVCCRRHNDDPFPTSTALNASAPVASPTKRNAFFVGGHTADCGVSRPGRPVLSRRNRSDGIFGGSVSILWFVWWENARVEMKNFRVSHPGWFYQVARWVSVRNLEPRSRYYRIRNNSVHGLVAHCWVKRDSHTTGGSCESERAIETRRRRRRETTPACAAGP
jgi:hypothetical protein